jgi:N,N'-diacetyllegionaminate synthase
MIKKNHTFIIAEAGVNHNGNLKLAKRLIDISVDAGADAVKFQTFNANEVISKNAKKINYQRRNFKDKDTQLNMLKKLELKNNEFKELFDYCKKKKIIFLSTAKDLISANFLNTLNVKAHKVGSGDIINHELLRYLGKTNKPIIISTGMANLKEIGNVFKLIKNKKNIHLLHCVSLYPTALKLANLNTIPFLKKKFKVSCGFSDHTPNYEASIAAVALGAHIIEKHITLNKKMLGPDHKTSLDPSEFKIMVNSIRNIDTALGSFNKVLSKKEKKNIKLFRRGLVFNKDIKKYAKITSADIGIKRPLTGLKPEYKPKIIGKILRRNVKEDQPINFNCFK